MEQRATALIRKCLILAYIMKWIETDQNMLGEISSAVLGQIHKNSLAEIVYLKQIMRRNGIRVIDRKSQPKDIWVKFVENNLTSEAVYPKMILMADVKAQIKIMMQELVEPMLQMKR